MAYKDLNKKKEYHRNYRRKYYLKNRDKEKEACRIWRENNRDRWNEFSRNWQKNHPQKVKRNRMIAYARIKQLRKDIKESESCEICGKNRPPYLIFHHRNPSEKTQEVNRLYGCNKSELEAEIKKCQILCVSCHMKLHKKMKKEGLKCQHSQH